MKSTRRVRRRKQTRRRKRKGGEKVGQGNSGMVIKPAISCRGKDTTDKVSKVFFGKENFERIKNSIGPVLIKLKEIDPEQKYFLYPELCDDIGELTEENKKDGVTEENKQYSYLMKRGKNETLLKFIETTKPSEEEAVAILKKVQEILNLLHKHNIYHGDFHSENVLRMDDGTFRIIDFDVSRIVTEEELKPVYRGPYLMPSKMKEKLDEEGQYIVEETTFVTKLKFEPLFEKVFD